MSLTLAHWIKYWLDVVPERVWGFFFGLIIAMGIALVSDLRSAADKRLGFSGAWRRDRAGAGLQTPQSADPRCGSGLSPARWHCRRCYYPAFLAAFCFC